MALSRDDDDNDFIWYRDAARPGWTRVHWVTDKPVMQTGRTTQFGNFEPAAMRCLTSEEVKWNAEMIEASGCGNEPTTRTECQTCSLWQSKMQRWLVQLPSTVAANAVSAVHATCLRMQCEALRTRPRSTRTGLAPAWRVAARAQGR